MEALTVKLSNSSMGQSEAAGDSYVVDHITSSITEFLYDPQAHLTFDSWYKPYEDLFSVDLAAQDDAWKVRLPLRKLGPTEHARYAKFVLPKNPREVTFKGTVQTLSQVFGYQSSLFNTRFRCLQLCKRDSDDFITYAGIVNRECGRFQLGSLTENQFKCPIFICGLQSPKDADIRTRLLSRVQQNNLITPQKRAAECQTLINLRHDSAMIQNPASSFSVHSVTLTESRPKPPGPIPTNDERNALRHPWHSWYLDDILIVGRSPAELQERVCAVLERVQEYGFRLRDDKCQFFLDSIKYLGFVFDVTGHNPDPENIRAIQRVPAPKNVSQLRSFLGLISYYSAFLPSLHDSRGPLNRLLQKDAPWCWSPDCEKAFVKLKSMLSSDLLLTHYDPTLPIVVAADDSNHGVDAVISHTFPDRSKKAIMHSSRTLTPAENCRKIEEEAVALVFAVKKFHELLYGRHFTLLANPKPLPSSLGSKKDIPVYSASRLQRWATNLLGYDFDIRYCRTTDSGQADALSRLISNQQEPEEGTVVAAISIEVDVCRQLPEAIRGIPVTAADIRRATEQDPVLRQAITYAHTCWPTTALAGDLRQLFLRRASLSVPGIDGDIDDLVRRCSRCQQAAKMPPRQPPVPWEPPERPWSRVHIDFAGPLNGVSYLILVDAYSKWPEIAPLNPATASATITFLRRIFSQHGLPEVLVSDNGSQFTSSTFEDCCRQHNIQHLRSPPYHPQSNAQAKRFVDTFKRALLKACGDNTEPGVPWWRFSCRSVEGPKTALVRTGAQPAQTSPVSRSKLSIGTPVFVRDYRVGSPDWIKATVVAHRGSMLLDVDVGDDNWVRHRNQVRRRNCSNTSGFDSAPSLPLDILLDTLAIPADRSVPETTAAPPSDIPPSVSVTAPVSPGQKPRLRRRTNRVRRSTWLMQVNPRQKRY
nr:unnamed protein product [Spirometra erinaceieuropaei]